MKLFFLIICFLTCCKVSSQDTSISNDKYSGVLGIFSNPAYMVNSPYKADVNIISNFSSFGNNITDIKFGELYKDSNLKIQDFKLFFNHNNEFNPLDSIYNKSNFKNNDIENYYSDHQANHNSYAYFDTTILGPSFMYSINKRNSVAVFSALKLKSFGYDFNTVLLDKINNIQNLEDLSELHGNNFHGSFENIAWAELGASYATILYHKYDKLVKFGFSYKVLKGLGLYSIKFNQFESQLNLFLPDPLSSTLDLNGSVHVRNTFSGANLGQGLDFGFVFEKNKKNYHSFYKSKKDKIHFNSVPYKYRLAFSITDIGYINFNKVKSNDNPVNLTFPTTIDYSNYVTLDKDLPREKFTYLLPMMVHLNYDYSLKNNFYLNSNLNLYPLSYSNSNHIKSISSITVGCRYEKLNFSLSNSISLDSFNNVKYGMHLRSKFFFLGGDFLMYNSNFNFYNYHFFTGFKIPFLY
ncbi:DUF5723 family protein [Wenyingzhuangia sp. IMCC45574]